MEKVYLVMIEFDGRKWEPTNSHYVYSTREKAEEALKKEKEYAIKDLLNLVDDENEIIKESDTDKEFTYQVDDFDSWISGYITEDLVM